ncbi:MAG: hypothetical protein HUU15_10525 [Candidatus Brocadiae bacterium]|nr:hypothetical protein [Candidatus Brocadiia bacterium]
MSRVWNCAIFAFWALATGLLVREKVLPALLEQYYPTYASTMRRLQEEDYVMGIFLAGQSGERRIGSSATSVATFVVERPGDTAFALRNETAIDLSALGMALGTDLTMRTTTLLDSFHHVKSYDALLRTGLGDFVLNGVVRSEHSMDIMVTSPLQNDPDRRTIYFDNAMALSNGLSPFQSPESLAIGRSWTIHRIDPLSAVFGAEVKTLAMTALVDRRETIQIAGVPFDAFVVIVRGDRYQATAWISEDGDILQERVPFGPGGLPLVMRRLEAPGKRR